MAEKTTIEELHKGCLALGYNGTLEEFAKTLGIANKEEQKPAHPKKETIYCASCKSWPMYDAFGGKPLCYTCLKEAFQEHDTRHYIERLNQGVGWGGQAS